MSRRGAVTSGRQAALLLALLASACSDRTAGEAVGQPAASPASVSAGPAVGQRIPDFRLPDQQGRARDFASLVGPRGLVLNFNRSVVW